MYSGHMPLMFDSGRMKYKCLNVVGCFYLVFMFNVFNVKDDIAIVAK